MTLARIEDIMSFNQKLNNLKKYNKSTFDKKQTYESIHSEFNLFFQERSESYKKLSEVVIILLSNQDYFFTKEQMNLMLKMYFRDQNYELQISHCKEYIENIIFSGFVFYSKSWGIQTWQKAENLLIQNFAKSLHQDIAMQKAKNVILSAMSEEKKAPEHRFT